MPVARRYSILQLIAVTAAVAAGLAVFYILQAPPLGSLGLREASLAAGVLLAALWYCRRALAPRMALYALASGGIAIIFCVKYLGASDLMFGHTRGPPQWLIASTWAAGISLAASALWLVAIVVPRRASEPTAEQSPGRARGFHGYGRRWPWGRMIGMGFLAALCALVFFSGLDSLPLQQLEIDYYIKKRIVDSRLPIRQLAERLTRRDLPYRAELAATISTRVARPEDAEAIPTLAALLEDDDPKIRYSAASALSMVFHAMPVPPTEADLDPQTCARIIRGFNDPEPLLRSLAMEVTRGRPPTARNLPAEIVAGEVERFVAALGDADPERRRQAVTALRGMGPRAHAAAPALERRLSEGDVAERLWAALALSHVEPSSKAAIEYLANSLTAPQQSPQLRVQAAQRLGELGPAARASVPKFLEAWEKRMLTIEAAAALHRIDSEAAARAGIPRR